MSRQQNTTPSAEVQDTRMIIPRLSWYCLQIAVVLFVSTWESLTAQTTSNLYITTRVHIYVLVCMYICMYIQVCLCRKEMSAQATVDKVGKVWLLRHQMSQPRTCPLLNLFTTCLESLPKLSSSYSSLLPLSTCFGNTQKRPHQKTQLVLVTFSRPFSLLLPRSNHVRSRRRRKLATVFRLSGCWPSNS